MTQVLEPEPQITLKPQQKKSTLKPDTQPQSRVKSTIQTISKGQYLSSAYRVLMGAGVGCVATLFVHACATMNAKDAKVLVGVTLTGACASALSLSMGRCRVSWGDPEEVENKLLSIVERENASERKITDPFPIENPSVLPVQPIQPIQFPSQQNPIPRNGNQAAPATGRSPFDFEPPKQAETETENDSQRYRRMTSDGFIDLGDYSYASNGYNR